MTDHDVSPSVKLDGSDVSHIGTNRVAVSPDDGQDWADVHGLSPADVADLP